MPAAPELHHAVVIAHTADHILGRIHAVEKCPEAEEAPGNQQLEPDVLEVEKPEHRKLGGGVVLPRRFGVEYGHHVHVVDHDFHRQQHNDEADGVHSRAL